MYHTINCCVGLPSAVSQDFTDFFGDPCLHHFTASSKIHSLIILDRFLANNQLVGLREQFQEHPMIFMGKSMVSGEDFPLDQPIETRCHGESRHVQVPKGPFCRRRSHSRSKSRQLGTTNEKFGRSPQIKSGITFWLFNIAMDNDP